MSASLASLVTTADGALWLLSCALKASVLLAASWLGATMLRRAGAAARHQMWTLGVVGALLLPLLCWLAPGLMPALSSSAPSTDAAALVSGVLGRSTLFDGTSSTGATWSTWLALVWATGTAVVGLRWLRGHLAARRLSRAASATVPDAWRLALHDAAASLRSSRRVQLLRSESIGSPMTMGVLRPRVLLPAAAAAWSPERLRAVLVHELGHVQRHDTIIQLAAQVACALYWWSPLAWLAAARLRVEREHACDDLVLDAGVRPSSYAADLLAVARSVAGDDRMHGAIGMIDRGSTAARLRTILDATATRRPLRAPVRHAARGLALASVVILACTSSPPPSPRPVPPEVAAALAPPSVGTLSVGTPRLAGPDALAQPGPGANDLSAASLDLSLAAAVVKERLGALEQCYRRRLAVNPALAGTVEIHWFIDATGEVPEACVTSDSVGDKEITDCVNELVRGSFPAPRGGPLSVSFPFVFTPASVIATR